MSAARIIKFAPTLILVGCLGYSFFATQSAMPGAGQAQAEMRKGLDRMVQDVLVEGAGAAAELEGKLRDPFWATGAPTTPQESAAPELPGPPEADALAEIVRGLTLDATFLQGRDQIAVINGRIYSRGARLAIPGDDTMPGQDLQVLAVTRTGVILKGGGKHYALGYPDRLGNKKEEPGGTAPAGEQAMAELDPAGETAMFQRLLNSPLGAMGKSLIGDAASPVHRPGTDSKGRARRSPATRARGPGAGGP
jgi:hypothetical protein